MDNVLCSYSKYNKFNASKFEKFVKVLHVVCYQSRFCIKFKIIINRETKKSYYTPEDYICIYDSKLARQALLHYIKIYINKTFLTKENY